MAHDHRSIDILKDLENQVLWGSTYMIHNANHIRESVDGLKVGGHQASCASMVTLMTALFFDQMRPEDKIAVKPHASPVYHAIMRLMGQQTLENIQNFRGFGGAQSYPSRTKDLPPVDFSTGSVGMGIAGTLFASLTQDYVQSHKMRGDGMADGRMIALVGDAEFDEGNIFESLLDGWKHKIRNLWWIVDYNRQSLDGVVSDALEGTMTRVFDSLGWQVQSLKFGKQLLANRENPGGEAILDWIDNCSNQLYSALTYEGGSAWRETLKNDLNGTSGIKEMLDSHDDEALSVLMTNLGGHCMETVLEAFDNAQGEDPTAFIAYTVKGYGLPLAGHKDNHAGLLNPAQLKEYQQSLSIAEGTEWDLHAGTTMPIATSTDYLKQAPYAGKTEEIKTVPAAAIPDIDTPKGDKMSTQEAFGKILYALAGGDSELAKRIITTSPDVTLSTNLSGWVNRRGLFAREMIGDTFKERKIPSAQLWNKHPEGQHLELGIAENNLFVLLGQLGLAGDQFDAPLIPIGTLYDPFISRGLDALNYALYQGAKFILVATPAGVTLGPEGGAHQSFYTPLIGIGQDRLSYYEPSYADELAILFKHALEEVQKPEGNSLYFRLSTRQLPQLSRSLDDTQQHDIIKGAYWLKPPTGATSRAIIYSGAIAPEVMQAITEITSIYPHIAVLSVTSPDRLYQDWLDASKERRNGKDTTPSHIETILSALPRDAGCVTLQDGHQLGLSWLGSVQRNPVLPLGIDKFGQTGTLQDLYNYFELDAQAIIDALNAF